MKNQRDPKVKPKTFMDFGFGGAEERATQQSSCHPSGMSCPDFFECTKKVHITLI